MSSMDDYVGRVQAIVWKAADYVSADGVGRVQHLVDHGEPAEAMCALAWIIVNENVQVPASLIVAIREHAAGIVDDEFMPPDLDNQGLPDPE
ncbi:hypothetical protein Lesp02_57010 [Lentzea sp. NBRC 105346]|uniref:hypothetical protein n=1 Tax=Lentzea sp. NBRC 105346 TaxID=3032205 RepID=UPI0024A5F0D8|nr:hypothetical protein [Lentzea sp. NBRC 105346]GLZ33513.1 hypothetical protein Lesp02_57010 [Lentzea sp. NBRC 105346]